jgi:hypothetical protein
LAIYMQKHPDLQAVIERWPNLPEHVKQAILTLISTVRGELG